MHYEHAMIGFNYRMSNLLAALGVAQMNGLDRRLARRHAVNVAYRAGLDGLAGITFMPRAGYGEPNDWLTCILVDADAYGATPEDIRVALEALDIESRPTWKPLHLQTLFGDAPMLGGAVSAGIFARGLCLPSGSSLSDDDLERVIGVIGRPVAGA